MATSKPKRRIGARVASLELLRLAHLGAASPNARKRNAAASIYSLLALTFTREMVDIPEDMLPHYKELARKGR